MDQNENLEDLYALNSTRLTFKTRNYLFYSGMIFSVISIASIAGLFYCLLTFKGGRLFDASSFGLFEFLDAYSREVTMVFCLFISSFFAFLSFKAAGDINRRVIPESDQQLLNALIAKDEQGIDQYIRLSSLSGTTGFFTKLGLTGMPLATIGLTIFFTLLSLITSSASLYDLAKLTLGAFLGSYVQKGGPQVLKTGSNNMPNNNPPPPATYL